MLKSMRLFSSVSKQLIVEPLSGILSDPTKISGKGFGADEKLTVSGQYICKEEDFDFTSIAHISTDSTGCFDLSKTPSAGGTYTGIEDMGLFWSMKAKNYQPPKFFNAGRQMNYTFNVFEGHVQSINDLHPVAQCTASRTLIKSNVLRKEIDSEGVVGTLFIPEGRGPFPAAIAMHGGIKRKHVIEDHAAVLANQGIVMLALPYFGVKDMPSNYNTQPIDIEYFEKAIGYLRSLEQVSSNHVGAVGYSKGAEIALAMSSHLPQLKFCCLLNTHLSSIGTSTVYKGETVEKIPEILENAKFLSETLVDVSNCLPDPREHPDTMHKFTKSNADMLLIVGDKDLNWKSNLCADIYEEEMKKAGKDNFKIVRYPNLGHLVIPVNCPLVTTSAHPLLPKGISVCFGEPDNISDHAKAMNSAWEEVFSFIEKQKPLASKL